MASSRRSSAPSCAKAGTATPKATAAAASPAHRRIQTSKQRVIRTIMAKLVADVAAKQSIGEFVKGVISGDLAKTIAQGCKPIHPVSRVEVRKSEVWSMGEIPPPAEAPPAVTEAPAPPPAPEEPAPPQPDAPEPAPEELTPEELPPDDI